jgi:hypothetical protein
MCLEKYIKDGDALFLITVDGIRNKISQDTGPTKSGLVQSEWDGDISTCMLLYKIDATIASIDNTHIKTSPYKNRVNSDSIGLDVFRNGRNVTNYKSLTFANSVGTDKGMYRCSGVRGKLVFNSNNCPNSSQTPYGICDEFDKDFGVTSLKNINEAAFYSYDIQLQYTLKWIAQRAVTQFEAKKNREKKRAESELENKIKDTRDNVSGFDESKCKLYKKTFDALYESHTYKPDDLNTIEPFKFDKRNGFFKKFSSNTYTEIIKLLDDRLKSITTPSEKDEGVGNEVEEDEVEEDEVGGEDIRDEGAGGCCCDNFAQGEHVASHVESDDCLNEKEDSQTEYTGHGVEEAACHNDHGDVAQGGHVANHVESYDGSGEKDDSHSEYNDVVGEEHEFHDALPDPMDILKTELYRNKIKTEIIDRIDCSNPEHRDLIDKIISMLNKVSYTAESVSVCI